MSTMPYTPKTHEIRSAAIVGRAPIIHRRELGITLLQAERIAAEEVDRWLEQPLPSEEQIDAAARSLNHNGWTCDEGNDEPDRYDECEDCRRVCRGPARAMLTAALNAHPQPTSTEGERKLDALNESFLQMRDRVSGYQSAPPLSRVFEDGGYAFEWAANQVRRARDGEALHVPPTPQEIRQMRATMTAELEENQ